MRCRGQQLSPCALSAGLVFGLLEDLVETITISECEGVFTYLEEHAEALERPRAKQNGEHISTFVCSPPGSAALAVTWHAIHLCLNSLLRQIRGL